MKLLGRLLSHRIAVDLVLVELHLHKDGLYVTEHACSYDVTLTSQYTMWQVKLFVSRVLLCGAKTILSEYSQESIFYPALNKELSTPHVSS